MTAEAREWWRSLEPAYKALGVILGAIALGMALMGYVIGGRAEEALSTANTNVEAIHDLDQSVTDFRRDFRAYIYTDSARWNRVLCHLEESRKAEPHWERCER